MSRTKNRYLQYNIGNNHKKIYKVGVYARVSVDNNDDSIMNQINLAMQYIENNTDLKYTEVYIDNGISGKKFDRKEYVRLKEDINVGIIDCIIMKDISRLGRDFLEVGKILEYEMVKKDVRVISINDNYDSKDRMKCNIENIILNNMINEIYIRDTSYKIKRSKEHLKKQGAYIGVYAPYGYKIVYENGIRKIVVNEENYIIVRKIIQLYKENNSYTYIREWLYSNGVNTKNDYRKTNQLYEYRKDKLKRWSVKSIKETIERESDNIL